MSWHASRCVSNNLGWYEAVLRTHGVSGAITRGVWTCRQQVPPYYSNAITVDSSDAAVQTEVLRDLATDLVRPFSVKDSFAVLELAPLGPRPLFDAEWIWRDPSSSPPEDERRDVEWRRVATNEELDHWEAAWRTTARQPTPASSCRTCSRPGRWRCSPLTAATGSSPAVRPTAPRASSASPTSSPTMATGNPSWPRPSARSCALAPGPARGRLRQRRGSGQSQAVGLRVGRPPAGLARRVDGLT